MKRLVAAVFAGLVLMATLAPAVQAKPPWYQPGPQPCICLPPVEIM
jgi:hypothetical protein